MAARTTRRAATKGRSKVKRGPPQADEEARYSKQAHVVGMLQAPGGTTVHKIAVATGWQEHSVRGFLSAVVRRKLKLRLRSALVEGERVYTVAATARDGRHAR